MDNDPKRNIQRIEYDTSRGYQGSQGRRGIWRGITQATEQKEKITCNKFGNMAEKFTFASTKQGKSAKKILVQYLKSAKK